MEDPEEKSLSAAVSPSKHDVLVDGAGDVEVDEHEDGFAAAGPDGGGDLRGGFRGFCLRVSDECSLWMGRKIRYVPARGRRLPGWSTLVSSQVTFRSGEPRTGNPGATVAATWATRPAQRARLRFTMVAVGRYVGRQVDRYGRTATVGRLSIDKEGCPGMHWAGRLLDGSEGWRLGELGGLQQQQQQQQQQRGGGWA